MNMPIEGEQEELVRQAEEFKKKKEEEEEETTEKPAEAEGEETEAGAVPEVHKTVQPWLQYSLGHWAETDIGSAHVISKLLEEGC